MKYRWKIESFSKNVDVNAILAEIETVENTMGAITPENIVSFASNKRAQFHKMFEWDDKKAGHQYRLQQARQIINNIEVVIVSNNEERSLPAYEIVSSESGREYRSIEAMTVDEVEQVREETRRQLSVLRNKLNIYNNFNNIIPYIDSAIDNL